MARILMVNGSVHGESSNSAALLECARRALPVGTESDSLVLASFDGTIAELVACVRESSALLFATGVYWSSWGSPLQRFLEVMTHQELSECFLGKPAAVVVSMDSVGGADVAQRLLGALNLLGCSIPPLASVVISRVGEQLAGQPGFEDVYQRQDIAVLVANLLTAARLQPPPWSTWPVLRTAPVQGSFQSLRLREAGST